MGHTGGSEAQPYHAPRQSHLKTKPSTHNEYTPEERVRYGTENGQSKVMKHLSAFGWQAESTCNTLSWHE